MADKALLIPGTGGTQLLKNGVSLGHPVVINLRLWLMKAAGVSLRETVLDMSMRHLPGRIDPDKTTLADGARVTAGPVLTAAYNQLIPRVDAAFTYDWRGDIEYSAHQLIDHLMGEDLHGGKWKLVAHSQGGLVALTASQLCRAKTGRPFSSLVSHLLLVAVPVYGTLNAASALVEGRDLGDGPAAEFRQIAGTWPALYQMLPDFGALRTRTGDVSPYTFLHTKTWERCTWVSKDLVRRAVEFKRTYLQYPTRGLDQVYYSHLLFTNKPTWDHALRDEDGTIRFGRKSATGDGLVPFKATVSRVTDVERQRRHVVGLQANTPEHSMVMTDDFVASRVMVELEKLS